MILTQGSWPAQAGSFKDDFNVATKDGHKAVFPVLCYFLGEMARGGDLGRV